MGNDVTWRPDASMSRLDPRCRLDKRLQREPRRNSSAQRADDGGAAIGGGRNFVNVFVYVRECL